MQSNPNQPAVTQNKIDPKKFMQVFFIGFGACLVAAALVLGIIALATGAVGSHDQLVAHGDAALAAGNYQKAAGHYERALKSQEGSIPARIGLCKAYEGMEEYEKMEEVAMRGISLSPATYEFYAFKTKSMALRGDIEGAHAFMQQITNEHVLLKINRNQPGDVIFSVEPGSYGEKITVELSVKEGSVIYYTNDGTEPTVKSSTYQDPFTVEHGTLTLRGFAMSQAGLVSAPFEATYTVRDGNAVFEFKDAGVSQLAHAVLGVSQSQKLTYSMLDKITSFNTFELSSGKSIRSLEDFKEFVNLSEIHLYNQSHIDDFSVLAQIPTLRKLTLDNCAVTNDSLKQIAKATQITHLTVDNNGLTSTANLSGMKGLTVLSACNNDLKKIEGLEKLEKFTTLILVGNKVEDVSGLKGIKSLTELSLADNGLTSLMALNGLGGIKSLDISNNKLSSLSGISSLSSLETLTAVNCGLSDIAALSKLTGLVTIDLSGNKIGDLSALRQTGVTTLTLVDCNIKSLSTVSGIRTLRTLNVSDNPIEDVTPIISLPTLETLDISSTKVTMVVGLRGCGTLRTIRAFNCKLDDADGLEGSKITLEK